MRIRMRTKDKEKGNMKDQSKVKELETNGR